MDIKSIKFKILLACIVSIACIILLNYCSSDNNTIAKAKVLFSIQECSSIEIKKEDTPIEIVDVSNLNNFISNTTQSIKELDELVEDLNSKYILTFLDKDDAIIDKANVYFIDSYYDKVIESNINNNTAEVTLLNGKKINLSPSLISQSEDGRYFIIAIKYKHYFKEEYMIIKLSDIII